MSLSARRSLDHVLKLKNNSQLNKSIARTSAIIIRSLNFDVQSLRFLKKTLFKKLHQGLEVGGNGEFFFDGVNAAAQ